MQRFRVVWYLGVSHDQLNFLAYTHKALGERVHQENTSDKWDIAWYTSFYNNAIENSEVTQCDIRVAHDGKVGFNTVKFTTAFLCSDCLYFLWHGRYIYLKVTLIVFLEFVFLKSLFLHVVAKRSFFILSNFKKPDKTQHLAKF